MNKIRVLLANYPMMIPDDIRKLVAEQEDMELVGDLRGPMEILQETGRTKADAVISRRKGRMSRVSVANCCPYIRTSPS